MEGGIFVAWDWQMIIVLVVTLLQNWLAGFVAKRLSTVIRSSAQQLSLLIALRPLIGSQASFEVGLLRWRPSAEQEALRLASWHNCPGHSAARHPLFCSEVIALSVQVFVFAGQRVKERAETLARELTAQDLSSRSGPSLAAT